MGLIGDCTDNGVEMGNMRDGGYVRVLVSVAEFVGRESSLGLRNHCCCCR